MNIEKEFVPYQEALALKEIGFDEPCFATWNGETLDMSLQIPSDDYFTSAPTFSQAFRWFRENHNLHHEIEYNGYEYLGYVSGMTANIFKTFEEAELKCLKRLIKILQGGNK